MAALDWWSLLYVASVLFWVWVIWWGGAEWLEGTFVSGLLIHVFAPDWSVHGIKLFAWASLIGSLVALFVNLFAL
jgi:hypothetical protein